MNRLVSLVMLVAFAVQQFACCCVGAGTHTCDHDHPSVAGQALGLSRTHSHIHGDEDHDHDACHRKQDELPATDEADHQSCPGDHSHQHHICVGTHIFFVSASRFELPPPLFNHCLNFAAVNHSLYLGTSVCTAASHYGSGFGPPLSSCPQRSAIGVYRI